MYFNTEVVQCSGKTGGGNKVNCSNVDSNVDLIFKVNIIEGNNV